MIWEHQHTVGVSDKTQPFAPTLAASGRAWPLRAPQSRQAGAAGGVKAPRRAEAAEGAPGAQLSGTARRRSEGLASAPLTEAGPAGGPATPQRPQEEPGSPTGSGRVGAARPATSRNPHPTTPPPFSLSRSLSAHRET